jgi:hypothetical protein
MFSGEVGALIVVHSSLSPFHQPHLAIPSEREFVSGLMVNVGLLHLDASGWHILRVAVIVISVILQFFVLKHKRRPHRWSRVAIV